MVGLYIVTTYLWKLNKGLIIRRSNIMNSKLILFKATFNICILYFQNVARLYSTRVSVITFTPISTAFPATVFTKWTLAQCIFVDIWCTEYHANRTKIAEHTGEFALNPLNKVWLSLHRFSWNSRFLNGIVCKFPVPNFTHVSR